MILLRVITVALAGSIVVFGQTPTTVLKCTPLSEGTSGSALSVFRSDSTSARGPPGERGPPGPSGRNGSPGLNGPPGVVNYARVNETIENAQRKMEKDWSTRLLITNLKVQELTNEVNKLKQSLRSNPTPSPKCHATYNGLCFTILFAPMNGDHARARCEEIDGVLANIYRKSQYDALRVEIRKIMTYHTQFHIGMKYDAETSQVQLRDGSRAPYVDWLLTHPKSDATGVIPMIMAVDETISLFDGMAEHKAPHYAGGAICELRI